MKILIMLSLVFSSVISQAAADKEKSFQKVKNVYISHIQKKIISMSETTSCMADGKAFKDLKVCADKGKAEIAALDKKAHDAHERAQKKKKANAK